MKLVSVIIGEWLNHLLNWFLHTHWFIHEVPPCSVYDLVTPALALFGIFFASKGNYLTLTFYLLILLYKINYTFTIMLVCIARLCKEDRLFSDFSWFCWIRFTEIFIRVIFLIWVWVQNVFKYPDSLNMSTYPIFDYILQ